MPSKPLPPTSSGKSHLLSPQLLVQQVDHSSWPRHPKASPQKCSSCDMGSHRKNMSWDRTTPKGLKIMAALMQQCESLVYKKNQTSTTSALENAEKTDWNRKNMSFEQPQKHAAQCECYQTSTTSAVTASGTASSPGAAEATSTPHSFAFRIAWHVLWRSHSGTSSIKAPKELPSLALGAAFKFAQPTKSKFSTSEPTKH